jgi:restriction endonuclease S subunit
VSLAELATDITDGDHLPPPKAESGVPFITISNIHKRTSHIDFSDTFKVPHKYFDSLKENKKPIVGDVLYTVTGSFGIPVVVKEQAEFCFQRHIALIRPRSCVDSQWLFYTLMSPQVQKQAIEGATGTAQKTVSLKVLREIAVPHVPSQEQRRIVAILDETFEGIDTAVANTEKNLANARELFDSYLTSIFTERGAGWVAMRLGDIAKTQYGLSEKMNEDRLGYKIFRMGEVQGGRLIDTGEMKYADITHAEFLKYKLRPGDVLFNRTNSYELVGKTGIFNVAGDYCFASYLVKLAADRSAITPEFLNYFMNSSVFQGSVKQKASRSINQANINATILSNEPIFLPRRVSDQVAIVQKLDELLIPNAAPARHLSGKARLSRGVETSHSTKSLLWRTHRAPGKGHARGCGMIEAKPGDLRTGQCADQQPGSGGQNRDRAPARHRGRACGVYPDAQARGNLQGLLLGLFKDQTLEF